MPIQLETREITFETLSQIIDLSVETAQKANVEANVLTIAQNIYEPAGWVRGLWDADRPIGLIAMVNPHKESPRFKDRNPQDAAHLWRLMIDKNHQNKGYGALAMEIAFAQARAWGMPMLQNTCVQGPQSPRIFYEKCGLTATGRMIAGEIEMMGSVPFET